MSKFEVIIPVVNIELANLLLVSIERNTIQPQRIIIINNSKEVYKPLPKDLPIEMYFSETGRVNESINLGISKVSKDCDYVSILNDDLILGPYFFDRIAGIFDQIGDCAVACPQQVFDISELITGPPALVQMMKREGPAMTFRKSVLDQIPTFPHKIIQTFHIDDWFWVWTRYKLKRIWCKDLGNTVYHKVGASVRKLGLRVHKRPESHQWNKILKELGQGVEF